MAYRRDADQDAGRLHNKMEGIMHTREGLIIALAEAQRKREYSDIRRRNHYRV